jgi:hypothetical protein
MQRLDRFRVVEVESVAQTEHGVCVPGHWVEFQRAAELVDGIRKPPHDGENHPQKGPPKLGERIELNAAPSLRKRLIQSSHRGEEMAKLDMGLGKLWIELERTEEVLLGI